MISFARLSLIACLLLGMLGLLTGCPHAEVPATPMKLTIVWPAQTRDVNAPPYAKSCVIHAYIFGYCSTNPYDKYWVLNRPDGEGETTQEWVTPDPVPWGREVTVGITFYDDANATGNRVAKSWKSVCLDANGKGVGTMLPSMEVSRIVVDAGQSVAVGESKNLTVTGYLTDGRSFPFPLSSYCAYDDNLRYEGQLIWELVDPNNPVLRFEEGRAVGVSAGSTAVRAVHLQWYDTYVISDPVTITVTP